MFKSLLYGLWVMGGLSPVGISIFKSGVFPKSAESLEKMVSNSEHRSSNAFLCSGVTSASLNLMGSQGSMSTGEVIKPFHFLSGLPPPLPQVPRVPLYSLQKYLLVLS